MLVGLNSAPRRHLRAGTGPGPRGATPKLNRAGFGTNRLPPLSSTSLLLSRRPRGSEPEGADADTSKSESGSGRGSKSTVQPLLRQLREAVLSSLDVSDATLSGDWSDVAEGGDSTSSNGGSTSNSNSTSSNGNGSLAAKTPTSLWDTLNSQANSSRDARSCQRPSMHGDDKASCFHTKVGFFRGTSWNGKPIMTASLPR